jgi:hypothetical protein
MSMIMIQIVMLDVFGHLRSSWPTINYKINKLLIIYQGEG